MFPPTSLVAERLRAQSEFAELERQAQFKAASQPMRRWSFAKLIAKLFAPRKSQTDSQDTQTRDFAGARRELPLKNI